MPDLVNTTRQRFTLPTGEVIPPEGRCPVSAAALRHPDNAGYLAALCNAGRIRVEAESAPEEETEAPEASADEAPDAEADAAPADAAGAAP